MPCIGGSPPCDGRDTPESGAEYDCCCERAYGNPFIETAPDDSGLGACEWYGGISGPVGLEFGDTARECMECMGGWVPGMWMGGT